MIRMGQAEKESSGTIWFLVGGAVGVAAYMLFMKRGKMPAGGAGVTQAALMPQVAAPSQYPTIGAVATRLDELKTLYRSDKLTPEQAIMQIDGVIVAAQRFTPQEGETADYVVGNAQDFKAQIEDFVRFRRENPLLVSQPAMSGALKARPLWNGHI